MKQLSGGHLLADNSTFEQWSSEGYVESHDRARKRAKDMLAAYEAPHLDEGIDEALQFIAKRKEALSDTRMAELA